MSEHDDVLSRAGAWKREGRGVALATVLQTWGSSPNREGSQLAVRDDGLFVGSVSGGCVEGRVVEEALAILEQLARDGAAPPRQLTFGVANEDAWDVGLACGGEVTIYLEPID